MYVLSVMMGCTLINSINVKQIVENRCSLMMKPKDAESVLWDVLLVTQWSNVESVRKAMDSILKELFVDNVLLNSVKLVQKINVLSVKVVSSFKMELV